MAGIAYEGYYGISGLGEHYLMHHGVKGQKWGRRRYQYEDGLLTPEGRRRLGFGFGESRSKIKAREERRTDRLQKGGKQSGPANSKASSAKKKNDTFESNVKKERSLKASAKSINRSTTTGAAKVRHMVMLGVASASLATIAVSSNQKINRGATIVGSLAAAGVMANGIHSSYKAAVSSGQRRKR